MHAKSVKMEKEGTMMLVVEIPSPRLSLSASFWDPSTPTQPKIFFEDTDSELLIKMLPPPPAKMPLMSEILLISLLTSAQLMTQAGLALSVVPMFIIGKSLHASDAGEMSWFTSAYSLTVGTFILIAGRLGDTFGHKRFFVAGFLWFGIWCIVGGLAVYSNQILFDISRAMQGIGPAFLMPNASAIIGRTWAGQHKKQNMVFGLFGATAPGGFVLGAVFSSLLSQRLGWQWAYWIMALACICLGLLGIFILPRTEHEEEHSTVSLFKRLDILGSVTGVCGLVLFNFAWNEGASVGWEALYIGATLILGVIIFGTFVFIEMNVSHPLVPFRLLDKSSVLSLICISSGWASFGVFVLYLWSFFESIRHQTPLVSSAQFSIVALSGLCAAVATGLLITHVRISFVMLCAMAAFTVGGLLWATMPVNQIYWAQTFLGALILPLGMDISFPAGTIVLSRAMPKNHQGVAGSLVSTVLNYSISIGLGIAGTVQLYVQRGGASPLAATRAAWYTGVGLAGLGLCVALAWSLSDLLGQRKKRMEELSEDQVELKAVERSSASSEDLSGQGIDMAD